MMADGLLFGASLVAIAVGTSCTVWPRKFARLPKPQDKDQSPGVEELRMTSSKVWKVRAFGMAALVVGVTVLVAAILGTTSPADIGASLH